MAIMVACPAKGCSRYSSPSRTRCTACGAVLKRRGNRKWVVRLRIGGRQVTQTVGWYPNRKAAEAAQDKMRVARTEGSWLAKDTRQTQTLGQIETWYLGLNEVQARRSYADIKSALDRALTRLKRGTPVSSLTLQRAGEYRAARVGERSARGGNDRQTPGADSPLVSPQTVNRELGQVRAMLNAAVTHGKLRENPWARLKATPEKNVRRPIVSPADFERLLAACPDYLRGPVEMAYHEPMRQREILDLDWSEVDLPLGVLRLGADRTKTGQARVVPLHPAVLTRLKGLASRFARGRVWLRDGEPIRYNPAAFRKAVAAAGLTACVQQEGKTDLQPLAFHDLRHLAINNLRLAGNDHLTIMAAAGATTPAVFQRYNMVTEEEVRGMRWADNPVRQPGPGSR